MSSSSSLRRLGAVAAVTAAALAVAPAAHAATGSVSAGATSRDADTGFDVTTGQVLTASVTADFDYCNRFSPCNRGNVQAENGSGWDPLRPNAGLGGAHFKIGDGPWRSFKRSADNPSVSLPVRAQEAGRLRLSSNDNARCLGPESDICYLDNPGSMTVTIADPPPDGDGDGVPDASDRCPSQTGTVRGCPVPDDTTVQVVRDADVAPPTPAPAVTIPAGFRYGELDRRVTGSSSFTFGRAPRPSGTGA